MSHQPRADAQDVFIAIADPTRRAILSGLRGGPRSVNAIAEPFAMSRPAISKHLRVLRRAGLVHEVRRGRERHYSLRTERLRTIDQWLAEYRVFWTANLARLRVYVEQHAPRGRQTRR